MTCGDNRYLVGLYARAGSWVDGVGLVCAPYDAGARRFGGFDTFRREGWTGGPGGAPQEIYCNQGEAVTGLGFSHTRGGGLPRQYVMELGLFCQHRSPDYPDRCITSGHGCKAPASVVSYDYGIVRTAREYQYDKLFCPAGEYATGIHGRSGLYLDAIGLICAPLPPSAKPIVKKLGSAPRGDFAGVWTTTTGSGSKYRMELTQNGSKVTGSYSGPVNGTLTGSVTGNRLVFHWKEGQQEGAGVFVLAKDGKSFTGHYSMTDDPDAVAATWNGTRGDPGAALPGSAVVAPIKKLGKVKALTKVDQGEAPAPAPAPAPTKTATAIDDVDIYAGPGGDFENTGIFMTQGQTAPVLDHHPDGWYRLQVPCGRAECWVAEDHLKVGP
ncbi:MAG: hypothetical protein IRY94_13950 [Rhodospirillaceae bacterium]|nr:hypothetical protein [Rhodospirillaceae bacterium]